MGKKSILPQDKFEQLKLFDKKPVGKPKPYVESEWIGEYRIERDKVIEQLKIEGKL